MSGELTVAHPGGLSQRDPEQFELNLSAEARDLLDGTELGHEQLPVLEAFLRQRLSQEAWWKTDVSAGEATVLEVAAETEVTREMMSEVIADVTSPERYEMHMFLNALAASDGDVEMCREAYERRAHWEAENSPIQLTAGAVMPYRRQLSITFCKIFDHAMERDDNAKVLLRMLMPDFRDMPDAANYKGWLQRKMLNVIAVATNDRTALQFQNRL